MRQNTIATRKYERLHEVTSLNVIHDFGSHGMTYLHIVEL